MEVLWLILIFIALIIYDRLRSARGEILLNPGEGSILVYTGFKPRKVKIKLSKCKPIPGCSQLEDRVEVSQILENGFMLDYKIESGPRTVKWKAMR